MKEILKENCVLLVERGRFFIALGRIAAYERQTPVRAASQRGSSTDRPPKRLASGMWAYCTQTVKGSPLLTKASCYIRGNTVQLHSQIGKPSWELTQLWTALQWPAVQIGCCTYKPTWIVYIVGIEGRPIRSDFEALLKGVISFWNLLTDLVAMTHCNQLALSELIYLPVCMDGGSRTLSKNSPD